MGAIAESESLLRRVVPDDQGFNPEDPDAQKVYYRIKYKWCMLSKLNFTMFNIQPSHNFPLDSSRDMPEYFIFDFGSVAG